jgi:septal ring factor EnvC (AmiA/AmiB activator)
VNHDFIDLRSGNPGSESFWPVFTDIMTVVVMIFLLTSTVLMVRNWELIDQLRESMMAEQQASEMIRSTSKENATLEEQLAQAQNEISMLRMQLMQADEQNTRLASTVNDREQQIVLILADTQRLQTELADTSQRVAMLDSNLTQLNNRFATITTNFESAQAELASSRDQIVILQQEKTAQTNNLAALEESYGSLKVKYEKLIRPARVAKGKYVVSVHYRRIDGKSIIRFKDASDKNYRTVNAADLHKKLAALKAAHPKKLYIKIVIPEKSGLTYSEAWTFMKGLLDKYDYYYQ